MTYIISIEVYVALERDNIRFLNAYKMISHEVKSFFPESFVVLLKCGGLCKTTGEKNKTRRLVQA